MFEMSSGAEKGVSCFKDNARFFISKLKYERGIPLLKMQPCICTHLLKKLLEEIPELLLTYPKSNYVYTKQITDIRF